MNKPPNQLTEMSIKCTRISNLLRTTDGRDKVLKLVQYFIKTFSLNRLPILQSKKPLLIIDMCSNTRSVIRMGNSIKQIPVIIELIKTKSKYNINRNLLILQCLIDIVN